MRDGALVEIVDSIRNLAPLLRLLQTKGPVTLDHVCTGAQSFVAACVVSHHASRSCWILCPDVRRQEEIFNGLLNWGIDARFFPELELPAFEGALADPEIVAERLEVLRIIGEGKRSVVVLTASSLQDRDPSAEALKKQSVVLRCGEVLNRETLIETL
jgi:transcription-repair coupling factor (superfamily II helicase)